MTPAAFRKLALSMAGAVELPHFERTSFRVGKKIFATMTADGREAMIPVHPVPACLDLLEADTATFFSYGGWTDRHGALGVRLPRANAKLITRLLQDAWARRAPPPKRSAAIAPNSRKRRPRRQR